MWQLLKKLLGAQHRGPAMCRAEADREAAWWSARRRPPGAGEERLAEAARRWLDQVPEHARPVLLALRYPRIVNRLAALRGRADATLEYLDSLLLDERGGRAGFVPMIRAEIVRLGYWCRARVAGGADGHTDDRADEGAQKWADPARRGSHEVEALRRTA